MKRPLAVTIVACLYIIIGCASLTAAVIKFADSPVTNLGELRDLAIVAASALLAVVGGAFLLRGCNWARWLCIVWMAAHVVIGALHGLAPFLVHSLLLVIIAYFLLRAPAAAYFQKRTNSH